MLSICARGVPQIVMQKFYDTAAAAASKINDFQQSVFHAAWCDANSIRRATHFPPTAVTDDGMRALEYN